jgi:phosphoglycerate dehydrogenase-like enzyme
VIVLLETVHPEALAMLERADEVRVMAVPTELDEDLPLGSVRAVLTRGRGRITADLLRRLPRVEVVGRCGAGLDNVDTAAARAAGVPVVYAPGSTTHAVSEHALMLMLGLARKMTMLDGAVKRGRWDVRNGYEGRELRGKRLGIVGLGAIGRRIAEFARLLEMEVCYWSRSSRDPNLRWVSFDDVIATPDVLQICVAATPDTRGLIGAEQFMRMKPGLLVVNTARGQIVDHGALHRALDAGVVAGYGTDVWEPEPPADGDELVRHERVLVTPHVAGLTDVTYREICARPAAAAVAILAGEKPDPNCVYESEASP